MSLKTWSTCLCVYVRAVQRLSWPLSAKVTKRNVKVSWAQYAMPLSWKGWEGQRNKVKKSLAVFLPGFFPCIFSLTLVGLLKPVTL